MLRDEEVMQVIAEVHQEWNRTFRLQHSADNMAYSSQEDQFHWAVERRLGAPITYFRRSGLHITRRKRGRKRADAKWFPLEGPRSKSVPLYAREQRTVARYLIANHFDAEIEEIKPVDWFAHTENCSRCIAWVKGHHEYLTSHEIWTLILRIRKKGKREHRRLLHEIGDLAAGIQGGTYEPAR